MIAIPSCSRTGRELRSKASRKNKITFLDVEAPAWQGAEAQEYRYISALW
jgi:hypothetical protein